MKKNAMSVHMQSKKHNILVDEIIALEAKGLPPPPLIAYPKPVITHMGRIVRDGYPPGCRIFDLSVAPSRRRMICVCGRSCLVWYAPRHFQSDVHRHGMAEKK